MRRDVFQAIADPTRREIINMVAHKSLNLNSVAEQFQVSRPAISKHIKILTECGLVVINQKGRERFCVAKVEKLTEVSDWVSQFREMWEAKFDSLDKYLTEIQAVEAQKPEASQVEVSNTGQVASVKKTAKPKKKKESSPEGGEAPNQYSLF